MSILFVCTGNTCRSPLAAAVARELLHGETPAIAVESAGTAASPGAHATDHAVQVAREAGLDLTAHRARPLTRALLQQASLVLVMGEGHRQQVRDLQPGTPVYLLADYAEGSPEEVPDPFGGDLQAYRRSFAHIRRLVERGLRRFQLDGESERI